MVHIDPRKRDLVPGEKISNAEGIARGAGPEHSESLKVRRHEQLSSRNKRPEEKLAERWPLSHNAPDIAWRDFENLRVAMGYRTDQRRPASQQIDVSAELVYCMHGDRLGLATRMLHDLHCTTLDDEEFVVTSPCLEQLLAVAQEPARTELGQRGDLAVVKFGESDLVHVVLGHVSTSSRGQRACLTTANTA